MVKRAEKKGAKKAGGRKPAENRGKMAKSRALHAGKCAICNHPQQKEIEAAYVDFIPTARIAEGFAVSADSIQRHSQFAGLDEARAADTEKVLKNIIARGFTQIKKVDGKLLIGALKELNKITGKHKEPAKNPETAARDAYNSLLVEFADIPAEVIAQRVAKKYGVPESVLVH